MDTPQVISWKNMPARLPIWTTATAFLLLDRFKANGVVWGIAGTIFFFAWIVSIIQMFRENRVDMTDFLKGKKPSNG